jgi:hypothetical protein
VDSLLPHHLLHLDEVVLLGPQDRPGPDDADPTDEAGSWEVVMFHGVASDERACPPEASLAMDRDGSFLIFCQGYKFMNDVHGGDAAICEIQILVFDAVFYKVICVVSLVVETNHSGHS